MTKTLLDLAERLEAKADAIKEDTNDAKIGAATAMLDYLIDATPVDESTAESNWQIGVGRPVMSEIPAYAVGKAGSTAGISAAAAKAAGREALKSVRPGQAVYLSNLLPYIRRLNAGSSKQAPAGFVEGAIVIGRQFIDTVKFVRLRK